MLAIAHNDKHVSVVPRMFVANKKMPARSSGSNDANAKGGASKTTTPAAPSDRSKEKQKGWRWEHSWAKELIREALECGDITEKTSYDEIHDMHPEVTATDRKKLPSRMRDLRAQFKADNGRAAADARALEHDRKLFPIKSHDSKGVERWEGSLAQRYLKKDLAENKHLSMAPSDFYQSRDEYGSFSVKTIRSHIYQEAKLLKWYAHRNLKKEKKLKKFK